MVKDEVRRLITEDKVRPDGRKLDEIRPLSSEVGLLSRTRFRFIHTRSNTSVVSFVHSVHLVMYKLLMA